MVGAVLLRCRAPGGFSEWAQSLPSAHPRLPLAETRGLTPLETALWQRLDGPGGLALGWLSGAQPFVAARFSGRWALSHHLLVAASLGAAWSLGGRVVASGPRKPAIRLPQGERGIRILPSAICHHIANDQHGSPMLGVHHRLGLGLITVNEAMYCPLSSLRPL